MRNITDDEWTWLLNGIAISELHPTPSVNMTSVPSERLIELLDAKAENDLLKNKIQELTLRIQKLGVL
jgi:hypothetical protein